MDNEKDLEALVDCVLTGAPVSHEWTTELGPILHQHILDLHSRVAQAERRLATSTDWYQQRFDRLRRWVKEEVAPLSEAVMHRYFSIVANGSPAPHEAADWTGTLHGITLERDFWQRKYTKLQESCREKDPYIQG